MPINHTDVRHYAPAFKISINGSEIDPEVAHSILSIKIDQEINKTNALSFEVQDEFREGGFRWLGADLFQIANPVSIQLGYSNHLVKVLEGKIQNINASFQSGCAPTFTIEGADSAYDKLTVPSETRVFREKRDSDIVKTIAEDAGLNAEADATEAVAAVKTKQGGKTYLEFLVQLASENNYEFFLGGRRISFKKKGHRDAAGTLSWGKNVIRFEPQLNTTSAITEVIVRGWDAGAKKQIEGRAIAGSEEPQESGKLTSSQIAKRLFGDVVKVITDKPVGSVEEAERIARSELESASNNLLQATVDTVGMAELTPGLYLNIEGFGRLFSGKYYVKKATHTLGSDGYRTSLTVERNAA